MALKCIWLMPLKQWVPKSIYYAWYERYCSLRKRRCCEKYGNRIGTNKEKNPDTAIYVNR
ncbi:MAG: hypothetical protein ACLSCV_01865 [Acutalibacteraceae bacterium]